jgi:hypothetical protein
MRLRSNHRYVALVAVVGAILAEIALFLWLQASLGGNTAGAIYAWLIIGGGTIGLLLYWLLVRMFSRLTPLH